MSDFITNAKDRPCISSPYIPPPPLYNPIKNRLRKYISPGLIVGGLRYSITLCVFQVNISCHYIGATKLYNILYWASADYQHGEPLTPLSNSILNTEFRKVQEYKIRGP